MCRSDRADAELPTPLVHASAIRSQEHGEKKVFKDRLPRFSPELRKIGWHVQYDSFEPGYSFLNDPDALLRYEPLDCAEQYLLERISGVGITPRDCASGAETGITKCGSGRPSRR